jgi:hypothetical protein
MIMPTGVNTPKNTMLMMTGLMILESCSETHRHPRLSGPSKGAAKSATIKNRNAAMDHHSALDLPSHFAIIAMPAPTAAKRSPKARSEDGGGGPSL